MGTTSRFSIRSLVLIVFGFAISFGMIRYGNSANVRILEAGVVLLIVLLMWPLGYIVAGHKGGALATFLVIGMLIVLALGLSFLFP